MLNVTSSSTSNAKRWKREVMLKYDKSASTYDKLYAQEQYEKFRVIEENYPTWCRKILDAGCGTGLFLEYFSKILTETYYYVGLDLSLEMLKLASLKLERYRQNVDLIQGDIEYAPFRKSSFPCTFSITVFDNLYDPEVGLKELLRSTKKGGSIVLTLLKKGSLTGKLKLEGFSKLETPEACKDHVYVRVFECGP